MTTDEILAELEALPKRAPVEDEMGIDLAEVADYVHSLVNNQERRLKITEHKLVELLEWLKSTP